MSQKIVNAVRTVHLTLEHPEVKARLEVVHISAHTRYGRRGLFGNYFIIVLTFTFPNGKEISDGNIYTNFKTIEEAKPRLDLLAKEYGFID